MPDVAEFPIPEVVTPPDRVCVTFTIPDSMDYRQIFLGWFDQLTYWFNWQRDDAHNGITCSNLFKQSRLELIASLTEGCVTDDMYFRFRINPDDPCITEAQYVPDGDWIPFLNQNCCCDNTNQQTPIYQVNSDTFQLEESTDGGETWHESPNSPIPDVIEQAAPVTSGVFADKCDAATNGKQHIEDLIAGCHTYLETATNVFDLAVGVCTALLTIILSILSGGALAAAAAALAAAIWGAAHAAFDIGITAFDAYWTTEEKDKILCALYCYIGDDGHFNASQYQGFVSGWKQLSTPSPAFNLVYQSVLAAGRSGLNNMCSYGSEGAGDCASCDCPECESVWDFTETDDYLGVAITEGTWIDGQGVEINHPRPPTGDFYGTIIIVFAEPCDAKYIEFTSHFTTGHGSGSFDIATETDSEGEYIWTPSGGSWSMSNGDSTSGALIFTPDIDPVPRLAFRVNLYDGGYQAGGAYLKTIETRNTP
jgi:hypothetical protein